MIIILLLSILGWTSYLWYRRRNRFSLTLHIRDLVLECRVGLHDHEKQAPQKLRINASILCTWKRSEETSASVVCYGHIVETLRHFQERRHVDILENLARQMIDAIGVHPRMRQVKLRVDKCDIFDDAESVGVEIVKNF